MNSDPIRAALERLVRMHEAPRDEYEYYDAMVAARAALAAAPEGEPSDDQLDLVVIAIQALTPHQPDATTHDLHAVDRGREILRQSLARWGRPATPPALAPGYIDPEHQGEDLDLLQIFYRACNADGGTADEIHLRGIRAVLAARPATPPAPPEGQVGELVAWLKSLEGASIWFEPGSPEDRNRNRAATLLERQHHLLTLAGAELDRFMEQQISASAPAVVPVPVSQRPWERPGWCNEQGRCWLHGIIEGDWRLMDPAHSGLPQLKYCFSYSLPAHAIPLPAPQGGELEGSDA